MSDEEKKIFNILDKAIKEETHIESRRASDLAMTAVVVATVVLTALLSYLFFTPKIARLEGKVIEAGTRATVLEAEKAKLASEVKRQRELIYYSELLPVKDLRVRRHDGRLFFTGQVKNLSRRAVGDIKLTAFFTDPDGSITSMAGYAARPSDGRPLYRGQKRHFRFDLDAPEASDVHVVITGIEFK